MPKKRRDLPKYVVQYRSPPGSENVYTYFKRKGHPSVRLHGTPYSDEWLAQYHRLLAGEFPDPRKSPDTVVEGTFGWLCNEYLRSTKHGSLDPRTQRVRAAILRECLKETITPTSKRTFAEIRVSDLSPKAIAVLRDRKKDLPEAANGRIKAIRAVFNWATLPEVGYAQINPARDVQYRQSDNPDGHHTWTLEEVEQFEKRHPIGTKAHLALALLLYTGQRRSDVVLLGRQHEKNGWLCFTQTKNRRRKPVYLEIPIRQELRRVIDASPTGDLTFLVTEFGKGFTAAGFGNWFRDRCEEAGVPGRAHGLRKAAATRLADAGATAHEIMAITGHKTMKEVERYTRAANQKRLAESASKRK